MRMTLQLAVTALTVVHAFLSIAQGQEACALSVKIAPVKKSYIFQEPIRLNVAVLNSGAAPAVVSLIFPYFNGDLTFSEGGKELVRREEYSPNVVGFGGRSLPRKVEGRGTWEFPIFLQTYYSDLRPGVHKLTYVMGISCLVQEGSVQASSSGILSVRVEPGTPGELEKIIAGYGRQLNEDPAAVEALLSMDTPLVIPELRKMLGGSNWERAFQTLARFKGNPDAEQIFAESIHSKLPARQIAGLKVMSGWKEQISPADLKVLLESPSRDVRIMTLRYLQALKDTKSLSLVSPLLRDADKSVADEAQRTIDVLQENTR
jgi:hypothetical protein